jgi:four helix bundle protein
MKHGGWIMEGKSIKSFTDLNVWRKGHELVLDIYKITKSFPKSEMFSLTNQIQRCAVSITSNIAEGFSRQSYKDKIQFYAISQGSVAELQNQLLIVRDIGYIENNVFLDLADKTVVVHKLLTGLIKSSRTHLI